MGFPGQGLEVGEQPRCLEAQGMDGKLRLSSRWSRRLSPGCGLAPALCSPTLLSPQSASLPLWGRPPSPCDHPQTGPSRTHVLASFPPYIRWASFSSSMSQYLLQNSVTSLPWSFTAFMGG